MHEPLWESALAGLRRPWRRQPQLPTPRVERRDRYPLRCTEIGRALLRAAVTRQTLTPQRRSLRIPAPRHRYLLLNSRGIDPVRLAEASSVVVVGAYNQPAKRALRAALLGRQAHPPGAALFEVLPHSR